ncbi:MAG: 16S rRNA (cytidine(1402)-2'-O)-methyltransferase [Bradymonadales bacterium]|jgi:16S rRNA (cytidine1402-2'-O)-methyltransferase
MLYIVAGPIGNLTDISKRAIQVLESVDFILCEDTRHSSILLDALNIKKKLISYFAHNEAARIEQILPKLHEGQNAALISDAGTPGICDPGMRIVSACHDAKIPVVPIPGPCALISAISACGIMHERFKFIGFLPRQSKEQCEIFQAHKTAQELLVAYESPRRLRGVVQLIVQILGEDWELCMAREISKKFEEIRRCSAIELHNELKNREVKGEVCLILAPANAAKQEELPTEAICVIDELRGKISDRDIRDLVVKAFKLRPKQVYDYILDRE